MSLQTNKTKKTLLITLISLLSVVLIAFIVLFIIAPEENEETMKNIKALNGITVNGIDISGMTKEEALDATSNIPEEVLNNIKISIDLEVEKIEYSAKDLGITTDYYDIITKAVNCGNTGSIFMRWLESQNAKKGIDFTIKVVAVKDEISAVVMAQEDKFNKAPQDATVVFAPWGYLSDGTLYQQDQQTMIQSVSNGKLWSRPDLVTISQEQMPNKLRYQYWKNDQYEPNYIPKDASISRFQYKEAVYGTSVDMNHVIDGILNAVQNNDYSVIKIQAETVAPSVTIDDLKKNTQLVASWTSSYSKHSSSSRVWNVAKLSGIINGQIIQPGKEWSINNTAGQRTVSTGWQEADGIVDGGYIKQPGGGVCQISSTLYNASIRTNLEIVKFKHHSIPSDYIPFGLDATISYPNPDLVKKNTYNTPIYIVSYINPSEKNVTVEIYGQPVVDSQYGEVILNFSFENGGTFGAENMVTYYNSAVAPDGTVILPGQSYVYAKARKGTSVKTYKHTLDLKGNELKKENFDSNTWAPITGKTYVNAPDPATVTQPPSPSPSVSP